MKILVLNWQDVKNPLGGGAEVHLHEIFSRIVNMGHEVTLLCSTFPNAIGEEKIGGIRIIRRGTRNFFNFIVPIVYLLKFRHEHFDIVVDDINKIPLYTPFYVRKPIVAILHHFFGRTIFKEVGPIPALYVYLSEKLVRPVYSRVCFAVVSESTKAEMEAAGFRPEQLTIVKNCVDHSLYHPAQVPKSPVPLMGYLGRLKKYKSIDHLLKAFAIVHQHVPDARLVLVGEGDDRPRLERLVDELGLRDVIQLTGYVSNAEKAEFLRKMWFVVNPSSKEGWGVTVIEANTCGVPCIASNVPGLRDSVLDGDTGLLYEYGNIQELAQKMLLLIQTDDLRERLRQGAQAWAKTFDWNREAEKMVALLRSVLDDTGSHIC